ncbi:MAG: type II toxin-antitoxin system HicA family toxin [Prevotellaceae bacterium]|nr:type II toxin-antitoxin system HicA family toxin [Prevotellaceae bacterium]
MKCSEFHRLIRVNGWVEVRKRGSHVIYRKDGHSVSVPDHGTKEIDDNLRKRLAREMGL